MRSPVTTNYIGRKGNRKNSFAAKKDTTEHEHMDNRFGRRDYQDKRTNSARIWNGGNGRNSHLDNHQNFLGDESTKKTFVTPVILSRARKKEESSQSDPSVESQQERNSDEVGAACRKQIHFVSKTKEDSVQPEYELKTSFKILDESLDMSLDFTPFLLDQSQFLIIAIVGYQASGKSTIASFLADPCSTTKISRPLIFRTETKEHIFRGKHCTVGIDAYITKERVIILDFQPLTAPSVMDFVVNQDRKNGSDISSTVNMVEIDSIQMITLAMSICHVLLVVQDIATQTSMSRFLTTCSMMTPPYSGSSANMREPNRATLNERTQFLPHLVFVHNRMAPHHYNISSINDMQTAYFSSLIDSSFFMCSKVGISSGTFIPFCNKTNCLTPVNTFYIPDFECQHNCPINFLDSIIEMRKQLFSLSRQQMTSAVTTEKTWYQFTCRTWEAIKKSKLFTEYNYTLP